MTFAFSIFTPNLGQFAVFFEAGPRSVSRPSPMSSHTQEPPPSLVGTAESPDAGFRTHSSDAPQQKTLREQCDGVTSDSQPPLCACYQFEIFKGADQGVKEFCLRCVK